MEDAGSWLVEHDGLRPVPSSADAQLRFLAAQRHGAHAPQSVHETTYRFEYLSTERHVATQEVADLARDRRLAAVGAAHHPPELLREPRWLAAQPHWNGGAAGRQDTRFVKASD